METEKLFGKYYKRLSRQGWIKALICGLLVGAVATLIASIILWFFNGKMFYLAFIGIPVGLATTPLFYKFVFKPTTKAIASKIDELGLEERMITMNELADDDSYIARRQRADAIKALGAVNANLIKLVVSTPLIVALAVSILFGGAMTTVNALANAGVISGGADIVNPVEHPDSVVIEYDVFGDGVIEGEAVQSVEKGQNATMVEAVPLEGYGFVQWSDGLKTPKRQDTNVTEDKTVTAIFMELSEDEDGDGDGDGGEPGDPGEPSDPSDGGKGSKTEDDSDPGNGAGGGADGETGKYANGEKNYSDFWQDSKDTADSDMKDKPSDDKKTVDDYFNNIKTK